MQRDFDEHVHAVLRQRPVDDRHDHRCTDMRSDLAILRAHSAMEDLEAIFRYLDQMLAMMKCRVSRIEASIPLKSEGLLPARRF